MNPTAIFCCILLVVAQLTLPRKWALMPLILAACYFSRAARIDIGPLSFTPVRILAFFIILRIIVQGEKIFGGLNRLDKIMITWTIWLVLSTIFTMDPMTMLVSRLGKLSDTAILYFGIRCFCSSKEEILNAIKLITITLIPISIEMLQESVTGFNNFSILGGSPNVSVRDGQLRANGPFGHAILAGTVGATCFSLVLSGYSINKKLSIAGMAACITMVIASGSSGPLMSLGFSIISLALWKRRDLLPIIGKLSLLTYIMLGFTMEKPAYYIIAKIDLTGSSTGWHRAALIESAFNHLGEWWFAGTEYTRHWMPTGVPFDPNHTDITNHYITEGVSGGLLQFSLYILCFATSFKYIGKILKSEYSSTNDRFISWAIGSSLFAHATSQISVSYFDQSILFIYLNFAVISSFYMYMHVSEVTNAQ